MPDTETRQVFPEWECTGYDVNGNMSAQLDVTAADAETAREMFIQLTGGKPYHKVVVRQGEVEHVY